MSELRVMRVGDRGVLAWHMYVDAGPSEWYEICMDANTGALLYRYNLYARRGAGNGLHAAPRSRGPHAPIVRRRHGHKHGGGLDGHFDRHDRQ